MCVNKSSLLSNDKDRPLKWVVSMSKPIIVPVVPSLMVHLCRKLSHEISRYAYKAPTSHTLSCVDVFPIRYIAPHTVHTVWRSSLAAIRFRIESDRRQLRLALTSTSSSWYASAKNSSETFTTCPPMDTLDSSVKACSELSTIFPYFTTDLWSTRTPYGNPQAGPLRMPSLVWAR